MSLWEEMANDGDYLLEEFGREITFRNQKVIALIDRNPVEAPLEEGGFVFTSSYRIRLLVKPLSEFANRPPKFGERMVVYGESMTIKQIISRPPSPWVDVFVIATNQ